MSVSAFDLVSYIIVLIITLYVILYCSNLRTSRFVLRSSKKDAFGQQESLVWLVGTVILALSGAIRFSLQTLNWMTSMLNVATLAALGLAVLLWGWVLVSLTRRWLDRHHVPKSNMEKPVP